MNTRNLIKLARKSLLPLLFLLLAPASRLAAQEVSATLVTNPPAFGTFYWLSGLPTVPYPFDPGRGLFPIWSLNGVYWVDDSELLQELGISGSMMLMSDPAPSPGDGEGGGAIGPCNSLTNFTVGYFYSTNGLSLGIAQTTNPWIPLTIQTATTNVSYDVFGTTNMAELALPSLSRTNWTWLMRANGRVTNFSWGQTNWCERYFQLGEASADPDGDGLSSSYEQLVSKTATNVADSPRAIYEGVISNQSPSGWFKLNDSSFTNSSSIGGLTVTNQGGLWDPDAFAIGNSAYSFSGTSDRLMVTNDALGGGTSDATNQGSFTLLFKAMATKASAKRYVLSQGTSTSTSSGNAIAVYFDGTNNGALTLGVGPVEQVIFADTNLARAAWYYLAVTCDETRASNEVRWYLGQVGSPALQTGGFALGGAKKFGTTGQITLGNKESSNSAFRESASTNGTIDQIAFWQRELTEVEVNAQFDTLKVLFQGPAKVFDLSRWNLLLPVDKTNQLNSNNVPLKITWLNSGFKYVDPTNWTQKYFYLSTTNTLVFDAPWNGADTDTNGNSARSELRETNPDGTDRNWLPLGTNILEATCMVNSAGTNSKSKVIIGQIHSDTASDPPIVISYNFPDLTPGGKVTVTVKDNPTGSGDRNFILATNSLNTPINYKLELVGTTNSVVLRAIINGVPREVTMYENGDPVRTNALWKSTPFYFKAGAYYPKATNSGTAKVTFSRLVVTPQQ